MTNTAYISIGVDIIGKRYILCILNEEGKDPRYHHGRWDTENGKRKFFSLVGDKAHVLIVEGNLATLALHLLGNEKVVIKSEAAHYQLWEEAGVERGERMAHFAAMVLWSQKAGETELSESQTQELFDLQAEDLAALVRVDKDASRLQEVLRCAKAGPKEVQEAMQLEQKSRLLRPLVEEKREKEKAPFAEEDTSFLAQLYRILQDAH